VVPSLKPLGHCSVRETSRIALESSRAGSFPRKNGFFLFQPLPKQNHTTRRAFQRAMTAVAPEPEGNDIERGVESPTPVGNLVPADAFPQDEDLARRRGHEHHHPFSVPEPEDVETGPRETRANDTRRIPVVAEEATSVVALPRLVRNQLPRDDASATCTPPIPQTTSRVRETNARAAPHSVSVRFSRDVPDLDDETRSKSPTASKSAVREYKHRASIGHDARVMETRGLRVQNAIGRPKVKSIFRALAGVDGFGEDGAEMHPKLVAVDVDAYGETWTRGEQRNVASYFLLHVLAWFALTFADPDSWLRNAIREDGTTTTTREGGTHKPGTPESSARDSSRLGANFWTKLAAQQMMIWLVFSCCGLAVVTKGWNAGYSRKVCHVVMYLMPFLMHFLWPGSDAVGSRSTPTLWTMSWTVWFQFAPFYLQIKPARRRSTFLMLVFRAYDRPQDRPHTLFWLLTQLAGGYVVLLALYVYLQSRGGDVAPPGAERAILIPVIVNVFGDGLAEPVGIAFGRHKYRARALCYEGKVCAGEFNRTLEGSFCVYIFAFFAVLPCGGVLGAMSGLELFSKTQYLSALVGLPPLMTVTEAFAPHTWDNPFITFVGAVFLLGLYEFVP
jgi:phytol kinase